MSDGMLKGGRQIALVTGAQRGIGRAIAMSLGQAGFDVGLVDLAVTDELRAAASAVAAIGVRAVPLAGDIADIAGHARLLDTAEQQLGPLDCLVNNAGVSVLSRGDLLEVSPESYDRCLNINTRGTFFLTQAYARRLVARPPGEGHRSIITITSTNARAASIMRGEYCVSKAALSMASLLFAVRLANEGIGVYEVLPGTTDTEMAAASKAYYDKKIEEGLTAISRWGRPEEIGRVVVTLAQGGLPYTVGQAIQVDGGTLICKY